MVSEHVTLRKRMAALLCGGLQVLSGYCSSIHQPLILAFLLYSHSALWGHRVCWCCRLRGMGLSEAPTCSNPDSVSRSLLRPEPPFLGTELCCVALGSSENFTYHLLYTSLILKLYVTSDTLLFYVISRAGDVPRLECLTSLPETLGWVPSTTQTWHSAAHL